MPDDLTRHPEIVSLHKITELDESVPESVLPIAFSDPCIHAQQRKIDKAICCNHITKLGALVFVGSLSSIEEGLQCDAKGRDTCKYDATSS